jgi:hypothetical protein
VYSSSSGKSKMYSGLDRRSSFCDCSAIVKATRKERSEGSV